MKYIKNWFNFIIAFIRLRHKKIQVNFTVPSNLALKGYKDVFNGDKTDLFNTTKDVYIILIPIKDTIFTLWLTENYKIIDIKNNSEAHNHISKV